ncbi:hypothetical protein LCGC14_1396670 [marine sediment metagenome]|uniref:HEPN domain-containing protein n=1 Tax=marine sediment metagenome TaxID=412755 RepID=A0A0F9JYG7_9ZZZZ
MTLSQAIRLANASRPISYRDRQEASKVLREAAEGAHRCHYYVLAKARQAHLAKLQESAP